MSVLYTCAECGAQWESGWGDDEPDVCRDCRDRRRARIAEGGWPLSGRERAAMLAMSEVVLTADNELVRPDGDVVGGLVMCDDGSVIDCKTTDGEKAAEVA